MNLSLPFIFLPNRFQSSLLKSWSNLFLAPPPITPLSTLEFRASGWATTFHLQWPPALNLTSQRLSALLITNCSFLLIPHLQSCIAVSGTASSQIQPFLCLYSSQAATCPMKLRCCPGGGRRKSWSERAGKRVLSLLLLNCILVQHFSYRASPDLPLQCLITACAGGRVHAQPCAWEEAGKEHSTSPCPVSSSSKCWSIKIYWAWVKNWSSLQCYLNSDEFLWNRKKHVPSTNRTAPVRFTVSDQ